MRGWYENTSNGMTERLQVRTSLLELLNTAQWGKPGGIGKVFESEIWGLREVKSCNIFETQLLS